MDTINDPVSTHTVTAVYLATGSSLHALERVGDSIRGTEASTVSAATNQKQTVRADSSISVNHCGA